MLGLSVLEHMAYNDKSSYTSFDVLLFDVDQSMPLCAQVTTLIRKAGHPSWPKLEYNYNGKVTETADQLIIQRLSQYEPRAAEAIQHLKIDSEDVRNATLVSLVLAVQHGMTENVEFFLSILEAVTSEGGSFEKNSWQDNPCDVKYLEMFSSEDVVRLEQTVCSTEVKEWRAAKERAKKAEEDAKARAQKKEEDAKARERKEEEDAKIRAKKKEEDAKQAEADAKARAQKEEEDAKVIAKKKQADKVIMNKIVASGRAQQSKIEEFVNMMTTFDFSSDGKDMVLTGSDGIVAIWSNINGKQPTKSKTFVGHTLQVTAVAWSDDGKHIVSGGDDGTARIWNAKSGSEMLMLEGKTGGGWTSDNIEVIVMSPDNLIIATVSKKIIGCEIFKVDGKKIMSVSDWYGIKSVAFAPDGKSIVTAGGTGMFASDTMIRAWSVETGKQIFNFEESEVNSIAWSMDGHLIATASSTGRVCVWQVLSLSSSVKSIRATKCWTETTPGGDGNDSALSVAFSPNVSEKEYVVSGHASGRVYLRHPKRQDVKFVTSDGEGHVTKVKFSPNGRFVAFANGQSVQTWFVPPLELPGAV